MIIGNISANRYHDHEEVILTKAAAHQFVSSLCALLQKMSAFYPETLGKLLAHTAVCADDSSRFTFRSGIWI